jgi:hypothetical protein
MTHETRSPDGSWLTHEVDRDRTRAVVKSPRHPAVRSLGEPKLPRYREGLVERVLVYEETLDGYSVGGAEASSPARKLRVRPAVTRLSVPRKL